MPNLASITATTVGDGPILAAAIHDGHDLWPEVARIMALSDAERLREEDPFTGLWTAVAPTRLAGLRSRFEVDLNRPRSGAVYLRPEEAWGLRVWREPPPADLVERSLAGYDVFYEELRRLLDEKAKRHGRFVVLDLHSYNHRRDGPDGAAADPKANPEVNLGTGTMPARWSRLAARFMNDMSAGDFETGRGYDVRENVRFKGGHFAAWIHENYPDTGCALSIEFKKFFMDEWTGEPDHCEIESIYRALAATIPGLLEELPRAG